MCFVFGCCCGFVFVVLGYRCFVVLCLYVGVGCVCWCWCEFVVGGGLYMASLW